MTSSGGSFRQRFGRPTQIAAVTAVAAVGVTAIATAGGGAAGAAEPYAQSVGRFLDGAAGGMPIQSLVDLQDARAQSPGTGSDYNPLSVKLLGQASVPIGKSLQLPGGGVFKLGAANQVAVAKKGGYAYGASGAVSNTGGVSLGGGKKYPADAKIDLSAAALGKVNIPGLPGLNQIPGVPTLPGLPGLPGLPSVPGVPNAAALGGIQAEVGAVSALAKTKSGGAFATPQYKIADLTLTLGSPALGGLLQQLAAGGKQVNSLIKQLRKALGALPVGTGTGNAKCSLAAGTVPKKITLDNGAVVISATKATVTVDVKQLLQQLGVNIDTLAPNTDLLAYVLNNLPRILSKGLENVINGITTPLQNLGTKCLGALPTPVSTLLGQIFTSLDQGQKQLEGAINMIAKQLGSAGGSGISQLTDQLKMAIAIGANVQQGGFPLATARTPKYAYTSALSASPDQATPVVSGQGVVRALEIDLGGGSGASLALGNAAAGPSTAPTAPTTSPVPTTIYPSTTPNTIVPTAVPAGAAGTSGSGGTPVLPLVLLLVALSAAGGGAVAYQRMRRG